MNASNNSKMMKSLATGLILGGLALVGLSTVGCDKVRPDAAGVLTAGTPADSGAVAVGAKAALASKMIPIQHNETFLVA